LEWSLVHGNKVYVENPENPIFIRSFAVEVITLRTLIPEDINKAAAKAREY